MAFNSKSPTFVVKPKYTTPVKPKVMAIMSFGITINT